MQCLWASSPEQTKARHSNSLRSDSFINFSELFQYFLMSDSLLESRMSRVFWWRFFCLALDCLFTNLWLRDLSNHSLEMTYQASYIAPHACFKIFVWEQIPHCSVEIKNYAPWIAGNPSFILPLGLLWHDKSSIAYRAYPIFQNSWLWALLHWSSLGMTNQAVHRFVGEDHSFM